jgi:2,3-bisphosphoglycerate-independent phosphoglycerate mutase
MSVSLELIAKLARPAETKILLVVLDGLGGLPGPDGKTELAAARTPNLDALAPGASLGLIDPVSPGITPGSGPGHLGLFGYDPVTYLIGRGVLSAAGLGLEMNPGDLAARINFCTVDAAGVVTNRRAGRIPTATCVQLCEKLNGAVKIAGVEIQVSPEREHRAAVVFRGRKFSPHLLDTDPQKEGLKPLPVRAARDGAAERETVAIVSSFVEQAARVLESERPANMLLLRGFDVPPSLPQFADVFKLKGAAIAVYPMYRGIARLVGMSVIEFDGETIEAQVKALEHAWPAHDFVYVHVKKTDAYGEDGNAEAKSRVIEEFDGLLPRLLALEPDVLIVTGDHSTPARLKAHSWHPSPLLLRAPATARPDGLRRFTEAECARGGLGRIPAVDLMPLALAHALRLDKYGA